MWSSVSLPEQAEAEGEAKGKFTLNDDNLPWGILQSAVQSPARVYIFLADSQDTVSLHMTTFFFFPGKSFASSQTFPRECLSEPLLNYKEVFIVGGD